MTPVLRVIDAGYVSAVRSQALWHGIADAIAPEDQPVLSFCRPSEPYVCVGYHRRLDELDLDACHEQELPVLRRQIGGGPVYLDSDQLFFQLSLPAQAAPPGVHRLYKELLEPAANALRSLGIGAEVAGTNDLVADGRKISGTGAGQIGAGVVVVGNVMFAFPHERMASVLALPDETMRREYLRLMRAHIGALPQLNEEAVKRALCLAYECALKRSARASRLRPHERKAIERWEHVLADPDWIAGPPLPVPAGRQVKVRAGVWVYDGTHEHVNVRTTVENGLVTAATVQAPDLNGSATGMARALLGASAERDALYARMSEFGDRGMQVLRALEPGLVVR